MLIIIFSFNRAMQLDCLLNSIVQNFKNIKFEISVIFHYAIDHKASYEILQHKYVIHPNIRFFERGPIKNYFKTVFPLLLRPRNLYRYLRFDYLRNNLDNFKFLTEKIISESDYEFVMFCTDDTYFDDQVVIPQIILDRIKSNPYDATYRLCLGENIQNDKDVKYKVYKNYLTWYSGDYPTSTVWNYNFLVDGIIYNKASVLPIMKRFLYHMPSNLESYINRYVASKGFFQEGYCPRKSVLANLWINRVQTLGYHDSANISADELMKWYVKGYTLQYNYDKPIKKWGMIPKSIKLVKDDLVKELIIT